jgi:protein SCO1
VAKSTILWLILQLIMNKKVYYFIFFSLLLVGFWSVLAFTTNMFERKINPISNVENFKFINQNGDTITDQQLKGNVYVASFFFVSCEGICPDMHGKLYATTYKKYINNPNFKILSHTVKPEEDSLPALRLYAERMKIDTKQWQLVTGNINDLYRAARVSYKVDDEKLTQQPSDPEFVHTQFFALVDKQLRVRAIYDGLKITELEELNNKIDELLKEK